MLRHEYIKMALSLGAGIAVRWTEGFIPAVLALSEIDGGSDYRPWVTAHLLRPKSKAQAATMLYGLYAQFYRDMSDDIRRALSRKGDPHDVAADFIDAVMASKGWTRWAEAGLLMADTDRFGDVGRLAVEKLTMLLEALDVAETAMASFRERTFKDFVGVLVGHADGKEN